MSDMELGVGIIYFSGFKNILESCSDLIHVVEIEPQTFWYRNRSESDSFLFNQEELNYLKQHPAPKLFHGVGYPIGGNIPPDDHHVPYLKEMISTLNPVWMSEHLSFNTIPVDGSSYNTNFLLPPLQTQEGIDLCIENIRNYSQQFDIPFAIETGTNYLAPMTHELDDGYFINQIVNNTDCHILLDVHNLLANERNGRQTIKEFLNQVDLTTINQVHLAGGLYYNGYYLDAHSGVSSSDVIAVFEEVVEHLPCLKAITFEMIPEYLSFIKPEEIKLQLEIMNKVWCRRNKKNKIAPNKCATHYLPSKNQVPSVKLWEQTLGNLVIGIEDNTVSEIKQQLIQDPGLAIIQDLISQFRKSLIAGSLKYTCRYLMLKHGEKGFDDFMKEYWSNSQTQLFASDNGLQFAEYLLNKHDLIKNDPILYSLALYESSSLKTMIDHVTREIQLYILPADFMPDLAEGQMPELKNQGNYIVEVISDDLYETQNEPVQSIVHT